MLTEKTLLPICKTARVYRKGLPSVALPLPYVFDDHFLLAPDAIYEDTMHELPAVIEISQRIYPSATVVLTPRIYKSEIWWNSRKSVEYEGREFFPIGGCYYPAKNMIFISLERSVPDVLMIAAHEAWHGLEDTMPDHWKNIVHAWVEEAFYCPNSEYYAHPEERRARAFQAWAWSRIEGLPLPKKMTDLDEFFLMAWDGRLAAALEARAEGVAA